VSFPLHVDEVLGETRKDLRPLIDQSFKGLYRWHARRTLVSVRWVRGATSGDRQVGLTMFTMLGQGSGYIYYIAVIPCQRTKGIGSFLLRDALHVLGEAGAHEIFACARTNNTPSIRLLQSQGFQRTSFHELASTRGFASTAKLWVRMVVAPGERVFMKVLCP
jgi:ribosomal protein S18 acetylase RimI-like enzyme